ncbi:MAG TPA: hypothetical protein VMB35_00135 [Methanomicrobiales archaeon]|nr:hypothetical protein [Methanomicrobiales archaeon]
MVNSGGQLYTMEGIAAGLIMLITAYLVLGSTSVYTPGDTHLTDMQLEQVGSDILRVMNTPMTLNNSQADYRSNRTDLELIVNTSDSERQFTNIFLNQYLYNSKVLAKETMTGNIGIQINATVWYRRYDGSLFNYTLATSPSTLGTYTGREPGVRVTRWVHTDYRPHQPASLMASEWSTRMRSEPQELLVEVVMWKV